MVEGAPGWWRRQFSWAGRREVEQADFPSKISMYSYIFRAARVNICRQRLLTPIPGRRGRRLALSAIKLFDVLVANCRGPLPGLAAPS